MDYGFSTFDFDQFIQNGRKYIYSRLLVQLFNGDHFSALVLQSAIFWAKSNRNYFYKFLCPCKHPLYRAGDSWVEELLMSYKQIRKQMKKLDHYIITHKSYQNIIYYSVNFVYLNAQIEQILKKINENNFDQARETGKKMRSAHRESQRCPKGISGKSKLSDREVTKRSDPLSEYTQNKSQSISSEDYRCKIEYLKYYKIDEAEAHFIASKFSLEFIKNKFKLIEEKYQNSEIRSIQSYAIGLFHREKEQISEYEQFIKQSQQAKEDKRILLVNEAQKKEQIESDKNKAYEALTQQLVEESTEEDRIAFESYIREHNTLIFRKLILKGHQDYLVNLHYRSFLYERHQTKVIKN